VKRLREEDIQVAFGAALRRVRVKKALSQEKLADLAGIHRTYVGDVERGTRNIALINMTRLAMALGVSLSRLIAEMEDELDDRNHSRPQRD
jgi:transcriptional regulator with XRE-family HTH domain